MAFDNKNMVNCTDFEDALSDYIEKALEPELHRSMAEHALGCPLCHSLLNEVKQSMNICRSIADMDPQLTRLEACILENTVPEAAMHCSEFEEYLTDYLDGFLPAKVFHRWERHAVLCDECTDLPGTVVRSLAALVSYKLDELPVPNGLHERILNATTGSEIAVERPGMWESVWERITSIRIPVTVPQLAPVAMMLAFAFLFISQSVSADGSLSDVYTKSVQVAEESYRQSTDAFRNAADQIPGDQR